MVEVERTVTNSGLVSLAGRYLLAAEILGGRRVIVRIEENTLMFLDPDTRQLLRVRPNPLIWAKCLQLRGARPAGPPPVPERSPVTVQRRANAFGVIMVTQLPAVVLLSPRTSVAASPTLALKRASAKYTCMRLARPAHLCLSHSTCILVWPCRFSATVRSL